jgi:hypothetical protein
MKTITIEIPDDPVLRNLIRRAIASYVESLKVQKKELQGTINEIQEGWLCPHAMVPTICPICERGIGGKG